MRVVVAMMMRRVLRIIKVVEMMMRRVLSFFLVVLMMRLVLRVIMVLPMMMRQVLQTTPVLQMRQVLQITRMRRCTREGSEAHYDRKRLRGYWSREALDIRHREVQWRLCGEFGLLAMICHVTHWQMFTIYLEGLTEGSCHIIR